MLARLKHDKPRAFFLLFALGGSVPIVWSDVVVLDSALGTVSAEKQTLCLALANGAPLSDLFDGEEGTLTKFARSLLAAHYATSINANAAPGAIASESEGGMAVSYALSQVSAGTLAATAFGRTLTGLLSRSAKTPMVV